MRLTLSVHTPHEIKRARHIFRRSPQRQNISVRNGKIYTMRYNPGQQPRTERQEKNWSIFAEANRLATNDFHNPRLRHMWQQRLLKQNKYKTARGLAKAHYILLLKRRMANFKPDTTRSTTLAISTLRMASPTPTNIPPSSTLIRPAISWRHYRNVLWFRLQLSSIGNKQLPTHSFFNSQ